MRRSFSWVFITVAALAAFSQGSSAQPTLDAAGSGFQTPQTIVGAWWVDVTPTFVPPFVSLGTFSGDGTLTNISSVSLSVPPESPGYGVWARTGRRRFASTFFTVVGDGAGNIAGTNKVRATMTVSPDGDHMTGVFQVDVFDPGGTLIVSDTGTVKGHRIKVEALP